MGKIILTVEGSTVGTVADGGGIVIEKSVSEDDSGRLIRAFAAIYADKFKDADGNPRQPAVSDVIQAWFDEITSIAVKHVWVKEQDLASESAAAAINKITLV